MKGATGKPEQLMLAILTNTTIARRALSALSKGVVLFNRFSNPHLDCLLRAYMHQVKVGKKLEIPVRQLVAHLQDAIDKEKDISTTHKERASAIIQDVLSGAYVNDEDGGKFLTFALDAYATSKVSDMLTTGNADFRQLSEEVSRLQRGVADIAGESESDEPVGARITKPFKDMRRLLHQEPRIPTGINWMDMVSGGGGRTGEVWLILGGSGGGKTVTAVQYLCAQALIGNTTALFQYEQQIEGDIAERIIANVTNTSLDEIRDRGWGGLDQSVRDKFEHAVESSQDNVIAVDMTRAERDETDENSDCGVYDVWQLVKKHNASCEKEKRIKTVILDWQGAMIAKIASVTGQNLDGGYQHISKKETLIAQRMAREEKVLVIIFHQLSTDAQQRPATYLPNMNESMNNRGLCFDMDLVLCIGRLDKNRVCWLNPAKTRKTCTQPINLMLIGDKARFELVEGWIAGRDGHFYNPRVLGQEDTQQAQTVASSYKRDID